MNKKNKPNNTQQQHTLKINESHSYEEDDSDDDGSEDNGNSSHGDCRPEQNDTREGKKTELSYATQRKCGEWWGEAFLKQNN